MNGGPREGQGATKERVQSRQIIVLGMHRSGTSAATGLLGACGAHIGDPEELTRPSNQNPKGFFERQDARAICDALLHSAGADWWKVREFNVDRIPPATLAEQENEIRKLVAKLDRNGTWVLKEPRICMLLPVFQRLLTRPIAVIVVRHPIEVAKSLRRRNGFTHSAALALWEAYVIAALRHSATVPRVFLSYADLVGDPVAATQRLKGELERLGVAGLRAAAAADIIDPALHREHRSNPDADTLMSAEQRQLWDHLARGEPPPTDLLSLSKAARFVLEDFEIDHTDAIERKRRQVDESLRLEKAESALADATHRLGKLRLRLAKRETSAANFVAKLRAREADLTAKLQAREAALAAKLQAREAALAAKLQAREAALAAKLKASEAEVNALKRSFSWRVTAPIRGASDGLRALERRIRPLVKAVRGKAGPKANMGRSVAGAPGNGSAPAQSIATTGDVTLDFAFESGLSPEILSTKFGRELLRIARQKTPPELPQALRRSEAQLRETVARLNARTEAPLVSIIMPTYNRADIIDNAIASVVEQHYRNWELLVCDDGSTDNTEAVVQEFGDSRIRHLSLAKQGAAAARNAGLKEARGTVIAYLDSDNLWHPYFLSATISGLLDNPGRSAVYADFIDYRVDKQGRIKVNSFGQPRFHHENLLKKNFVDLNSFVHHRELYDCFGGFNGRLTRRQDYDLVLKFTWLRDPLHLPCLIALYHRNENLAQITQTRRNDNSCVPIINQSIATYFSKGLPTAAAPPVRKVSILSWDMSRNHFAKPYALAEALSEQYEVQLISFRFFEEEIFPPLRGERPKFETLYLPGADFPNFFESMARALAGIRGDVIYAVKPRLPSLGLALLANYHRGTPVILEVNDLETVINAPNEKDRHREAALESVDLRHKELLSPYSDLWSQLMDPLAKDLPVVVTHNRGIDQHFGNRCLYMRNIKDERVYDPALYDRDRIRADLGFTPSDRVILFAGLLREHKGIYQLVELVRRLDDSRYKLLFVGSRSSPDQRRLERNHSDAIKVLPPQDREAMAKINLAADVVVLWLNPDVPASHFQMPYKATDALAMKTPIIANELSDLWDLGQQGYLRVVPFADWDNMIRTIRDLFDRPDFTNVQREAGRRLYLRQFSYAAARGNFTVALERAMATPPNVPPTAEHFARRFDAFYRTCRPARESFAPSTHRRTLVPATSERQ